MEKIELIRHSLSHILAQAVKLKFPSVKLAIGPIIEDGFYYDFDFGDQELKESDLKDLEKIMKKIIKQNQQFIQYDLDFDKARAYLQRQGEIYKLQIIDDLERKGEDKISFYKNYNKQLGDTFVDMCIGEHVNNTSEIRDDSFKLDRIAGAYWKGNNKNKMLTRIYGFAFENKEDLELYLKRIQESKKRDHKIIGKNLDLFSFHPQSPGSCFWHPSGLIIWRELENFWREFHNNNGYTEIQTPQLAKNDLWKISGHWEHYKEDMFTWENETDEVLCLKPMDCPFGILIYNLNSHSYRDLPIRFNEIGRIFRNEKSGQLNGLFRVRSITQDDAHIYCRSDQIFDEINNLLNMINIFYNIFDLKPRFFLSTRPESFLGDIKTWDKAELDLKTALDNNGLEYGVKEGDGAFYGPKIDIQVKDSLNRTWQLATIQLDFQLPLRFGMTYIDKDGIEKSPVIIHRAIFGSFERFIGMITEHFAGVFPLWLAPRQVIIIPVSLNFQDYAKNVFELLKNSGIRVNIDLSQDSLNKKVRNAEKLHINYILIVGEKEVNDDKLSIREYKSKNQYDMKTNEFISKIIDEIKNKR